MTIVNDLQFAREFNAKFAGFETDIHRRSKNGVESRVVVAAVGDAQEAFVLGGRYCDG